MSNIIWKQPDDTIAVTSIFDGSDPQEHATLLQARGDIPTDWEAVGFDWDQFPVEVQESWRWNGTNIVVDANALRLDKYSFSITAFQIRAALNQLNLRTAVEQAITAGSQDIKDAWEFCTKFNRFDNQTTAIQAASGLTDAEMDSVFDLGVTL